MFSESEYFYNRVESFSHCNRIESFCQCNRVKFVSACNRIFFSLQLNWIVFSLQSSRIFCSLQLSWIILWMQSSRILFSLQLNQIVFSLQLNQIVFSLQSSWITFSQQMNWLAFSPLRSHDLGPECECTHLPTEPPRGGENMPRFHLNRLNTVYVTGSLVSSWMSSRMSWFTPHWFKASGCGLDFIKAQNQIYLFSSQELVYP